MNEYIRKAVPDDAFTVETIYRSLIGCEGCVWNEDYPTLEDVCDDIENGALYVICAPDGEILGAAAARTDEDQDGLDCWSGEIKNPCEISRVGIKREHQHKGLASRLITHTEREIKKRGYDGARLLVHESNGHAISLYTGLGYRITGKAEIYGGRYLSCEKRL